MRIADWEEELSPREPRSKMLRIKFISNPQSAIKTLSSRDLILLLCILLLEAFNTTRRVYQFLLAGKERVAVRADFNVNLLLGRTCRPGCATSTNNMTFLIFGMDTWFHFNFSFALIKLANWPSFLKHRRMPVREKNLM
jgi:hypothetical protein